MPRILPDTHDQIVWLLNEQSGNYRNTGQLFPNDPATDLVITNTMPRNGCGLFGNNCPVIPGTSNFPAGSSATRNYASGASTITIAPPITVSCWVNLRSYTTNNNTTFIGKEYRDPTLNANGWTAPFYVFNLSTFTGNGGGDWGVSVAINSSTNVTFTVTDFPIPLGIWSHIGLTHDGSNIRVYINGCQCIQNGSPTTFTVAAASLSYTDGTHGFGSWKVGAVIATGSTNKEEPNAQVQDVRVANVVRPLSYFQKIYHAGIMPLISGTYASNQYFKLRAYDTSCVTPTSVTWVDTQISLANAPPFPCSGPYTAPEVLETWYA